MSELTERLDNLRTLIQELDFLDGKGLSNEVNIRIFCYDPKEEMTVRHFMSQIVTDQTLACHPIEYNLYQILLQICEERRVLKAIPGMEQKKGKAFIQKQIYGIANESAFITKMEYEPHQSGDVIILDGVGEVFPFMRVHTLLDAMQTPFYDVPIVVMYPGTFDGKYVRLFDKMNPNPYYRAFSVV